jgi:hypothetical protein
MIPIGPLYSARYIVPYQRGVKKCCRYRIKSSPAATPQARLRISAFRRIVLQKSARRRRSQKSTALMLLARWSSGRQSKRRYLLTFFQKLPPCLVGMPAPHRIIGRRPLPLCIGHLLPRCYPRDERFKRWQRKCIHLALPQVAVPLVAWPVFRDGQCYGHQNRPIQKTPLIERVRNPHKCGLLRWRFDAYGNQLIVDEPRPREPHHKEKAEGQ